MICVHHWMVDVEWWYVCISYQMNSINNTLGELPNPPLAQVCITKVWNIWHIILVVMLIKTNQDEQKQNNKQSWCVRDTTIKGRFKHVITPPTVIASSGTLIIPFLTLKFTSSRSIKGIHSKTNYRITRNALMNTLAEWLQQSIVCYNFVGHLQHYSTTLVLVLVSGQLIFINTNFFM
jgi:hypothetical protein